MVVSKSVWQEPNDEEKQKMVLHLVNSRLNKSEQFNTYFEYFNWLKRILNRLRH